MWFVKGKGVSKFAVVEMCRESNWNCYISAIKKNSPTVHWNVNVP